MAWADSCATFTRAPGGRNHPRDSPTVLVSSRPAISHTRQEESPGCRFRDGVRHGCGPVLRTGPLFPAKPQKQTKRPFSACTEIGDFGGAVFEPYPLPHADTAKHG